MVEKIIKRIISRYFWKGTALALCALWIGIASIVPIAHAEYEQIFNWPGTPRDEIYDLKKKGDYLIGSMVNSQELIVMNANSVDFKVLSRLHLNDAYSYGMCIDGDTLYVGQSDGIQLIDIADPLNMKLGDKWLLPYENISTNSSTGVITTNTAYYNVLDLYKKGNIFYLSLFAKGFRTMDLSNPTEPIELDVYQEGSMLPRGMDVSEDGNTVYLSSVTDKIHIVDVSNPSDIKLLYHDSTIFGNNLAADVEQIEVDGRKLLYVSTYYNYERGWGAVMVMDVTNPSSPFVAKENWYYGSDFYHFYPYAGGSGYQALAFYKTVDSLGYVHSNLLLYGLWDDPLVPVPLAEAISADGAALAVDFSGNYAYLADQLAGCHIMDITDPSNPVYVKTLNYQGYANQVKVDGNLLYLASGEEGIHILDITNPKEPVEVVTYKSLISATELGTKFSGSITDFIIEGDVAYLGVEITTFFNNYACLEVISLEDLSSLTNNIGYIGIGGSVCDSIAKYGDTVLLNGSTGYISVDVSYLNSGSSYTTPRYKGHFYMPDACGQTVIPELTGPIGYSTVGTNGLAVIDFSNAANIGTVVPDGGDSVSNQVQILSYLPLDGFRTGISVKETNLLVASQYGGFDIVDVSSPKNPILKESYFSDLGVGAVAGAFMSPNEETVIMAGNYTGFYFLRKENPPLVQTTIIDWKFNESGDFVMTVAPLSGNLVLQRSLDGVTWIEESAAIIDEAQITVPSSVISSNLSCYFRIYQWQ